MNAAAHNSDSALAVDVLACAGVRGSALLELGVEFMAAVAANTDGPLPFRPTSYYLTEQIIRWHLLVSSRWDVREYHQWSESLEDATRHYWCEKGCVPSAEAVMADW